MSRRRGLLGRIAGFSLSNIYRQFLGLFSAYIKPWFLSPEMYGLWHLLNMVVSYSNFADLGSHAILRYMVPYHLSRGEEKRSDQVRGTVFHSVKYIKLLIAAAVCAAAFVMDFETVTRVGLYVVSALIVGEWYFDYHLSVLKGLQRFDVVTAAFFIRPTIAFFTGLVLMYFFGIYGLYASVTIALAAIVVYLRQVSPLKIVRGIDRGLLKEVVSRGLPFMAYSFSVTMVNTSDRIIVASVLGKESLGYYAIAVMALMVVKNIPSSSREIIEPAMMESIGRGDGGAIVEPFLFRPLRSTAFFTAVLVGGLYVVFPAVITLLLPRYVSGIEPTRILLLGSYFLALSYLTRGLFVAYNWLAGPTVIMIGVLVFNVAFSLLFLSAGMGLSGVALATALSYGILFLALFEYLRRKMGGPFPRWGRELIWSAVPALVLAGQLAVQQAVPFPGGDSMIVATAAELALFLAVQGAVLFAAWRGGLFREVTGDA